MYHLRDYNKQTTTVNSLLSSLNESQRAAVEYISGPELVIAGAGSGKTRVLTYKIAYLLSQGIKPWNILALTFTNKAAKEMKERIAALVGANDAHYLNMGTFHSIFLRILRNEAELLGLNRNFTIYDDSDSRTLTIRRTRLLMCCRVSEWLRTILSLPNRIVWTRSCLNAITVATCLNYPKSTVCM